MRRSYLLLAAVAIVAIAVVPAMAFGNSGVHGNYTLDDDACAGCHRAHTAVSQLTWTDSTDNDGDGLGEAQNALLLSTSTTMEEFCYSCHDSTGQGAETNVEDGIYQAEVGLSNGAYGTPGEPLNGGLIGRWDAVDGRYEDAAGNPVTSRHMAPGAPPAGGWQAYGGGAWGDGTPLASQTIDASGSTVADPLNWGGPVTELDCATCHDVHGTSNYRILRAEVRGVKVGGYDVANAPTPWVVSCEPGFPAGGFLLHTDYEGTYIPNYTTPLYSKPPAGDRAKGMVGWCAGCHTVYAADSTSTVYSAADTPFGEWDTVMRYRHPLNVPLTNWDNAASPLVIDGAQNPMPYANSIGDQATQDPSDWIECLTCHKAHGVTVEMTGFANVGNAMNPIPNSGVGGVPPDRGSALLRFDNRGVCERCHNK